MKRTLRYLAVAAIIVAGVLIKSDRSEAFRAYQFGGTVVVWTGAHSDRYISPTSFPANTVAETLILESMGLWNIVPGAGFTYSVFRADQDYPISSSDGFNDTAVVSASQLDPGVLGVTFLAHNGASWFDMDVLFSDSPLGVGYTLATNPTCDVVANPLPTNGFSFLLVATHEMGHALGLAHDPLPDDPPGTPWFVATMNPFYPSGGPVGQENIIEVHTDDRNGIRFLYPAVDPPFRDLAAAAFVAGSNVGAAEPLAATPAILFPGGELTLDSLIENFGTTDELSVRQGFYLSTDAIIDAGDQLIGTLLWDIVAGDALQFGVAMDLPADIAAGTYYVGSILDDLGQVVETYEDNNAAIYCNTVTIEQFPPVIVPPGMQTVGCGRSYVGPAPGVTLPLNMSPVWSMDNPLSGMSIDPASGAILWASPTPSVAPLTVTIRATNASGSASAQVQLKVVAGDTNGDATIDLPDLFSFSGCVGGPDSAVGSGCDCADIDRDGDIDLIDIGLFQTLFQQ